jgi:hypothetical protein
MRRMERRRREWWQWWCDRDYLVTYKPYRHGDRLVWGVCHETVFELTQRLKAMLVITPETRVKDLRAQIDKIITDHNEFSQVGRLCRICIIGDVVRRDKI